MLPYFVLFSIKKLNKNKKERKLNIIKIAQADRSKNIIPFILSWLLRKYHEGFYYRN